MIDNIINFKAIISCSEINIEEPWHIEGTSKEMEMEGEEYMNRKRQK
jgi:hypothetical protein